MGTGMKTKMQTRKHMHKSMCVTMDVDKAAAVTMAMPTDMIMRACHGRHRGHDMAIAHARDYGDDHDRDHGHQHGDVLAFAVSITMNHSIDQSIGHRAFIC